MNSNRHDNETESHRSLIQPRPATACALADSLGCHPHRAWKTVLKHGPNKEWTVNGPHLMERLVAGSRGNRIREIAASEDGRLQLRRAWHHAAVGFIPAERQLVSYQRPHANQETVESQS